MTTLVAALVRLNQPGVRLQWPAHRLSLLFALVLLLFACAPKITRPPEREYNYAAMDKATRHAYRKVDQFLQRCIALGEPIKASKLTRIDTILIDHRAQRVAVHLNPYFSYQPFREDNTAQIYRAMKAKLGRKFKNYSLTIHSLHQPIEQLIPNVLRSDSTRWDRSRMPVSEEQSRSLVRNLSKPWQPTRGLVNRHVALWHSHGWYYEHKLKRWEFQRARLFQTIEDLSPLSFTVPYLIPMLENAGANVFVPRERDVQRNEAVIDNDTPDDNGYGESSNDGLRPWVSSTEAGFAIGKPPYGQGVNPFKQGSYRFVLSDTVASAQVQWTPEIPAAGDYAVYVSYAASEGNVAEAHYTVNHAGGSTAFSVNQQMGGGTWIYLGTFHFEPGRNQRRGSVVLSNRSSVAGLRVTADAVRFGGGMGNILREGTTSERPRFVEAARYYMQYAGMPDTLVYNVTDTTNDYVDDYQGRGEWVNFLKGAPFGPNKNRQTPGLNIPIDLSLAFHTDAGLARSDSVVGTLLIYSSEGADSATVFPDGMSRFANRDFADVLQTQLVSDVRAKYDSIWTRRELWDRGYSEAFRPNVPAALLELLSHQSFLDMRFGLDPRFRFDASRAIYKAILRFLAFQHQQQYAVQPLPVTHLRVEFTSTREIMLSWRATEDPLEPTAVAEKFIVYTRLNGGGFDNGKLVAQPELVLSNILPDSIYSFKITAVNAGGESFPSEVVSIGHVSGGRPPVLIINGFDRVAAPAIMETENLSGFVDLWDQGVPDKYDASYVGAQFNFDVDSPWLDDDAPGHGASYGDYETTIIAGNTFDFAYVHGRSIRAAGYSFVSVSDEAVMAGLIDLTDYRVIDLILGEEKETDWPKPLRARQFKAFPEALQVQIERFLQSGGSLFLSGSYVGTELFEGKSEDHRDVKFGREQLKYFWRTNHAARTGGIVCVDSTFLPWRTTFDFNTELGPDVYAAEAPDAIEPADSLAVTILRYRENNMSAGVAYRGAYKVIALGFPFETILTKATREQVMRAALDWMLRK